MTQFSQRRWKLCVGLALAGCLAGLGVFWTVGSYLCAPNNHPVRVPENLPVEAVSFPSASGATLRGWLVSPAPARGVVILQHGVHSTRASMVGRARFLSAAGYAVLLFDFQAHGESVGQRITFGHLESRDSQAAVAFVKQRFPRQPVALIGVSLGGAAALLAEPPLDVQALVLESVFPTIVDATKDRLEWLFTRPARCLSPLLTCQFKLRMGISPDALRPIDHAARLKTPKLFLAGTADPRTRFSEAQQMFTLAAEPKPRFSVPGAGHEDLHRYLGARYEQLILEFLVAHLK